MASRLLCFGRPRAQQRVPWVCWDWEAAVEGVQSEQCERGRKSSESMHAMRIICA